MRGCAKGGKCDITTRLIDSNNWNEDRVVEESPLILSNFITEKPDFSNGLDQKLDEILRLLKQNTPINSE